MLHFLQGPQKPSLFDKLREIANSKIYVQLHPYLV